MWLLCVVGLGAASCLLFTSVWIVWFGFVNSVVLLPLLFGYVAFLISVNWLWC